MPDPQHIAYLLAREALRSAKADVARRFLEENDCYDARDPEDVATAVMVTEQAFDLCQQADRIARQMMSSHTHEAAIAELKRKRPGYSDETYTQAITEAFSHASR
jgi:hypothetical protein